MTHALIVIDMQRDFCPGGALAVPEGDRIVAPINAMMPDYDAVILTQDWHPADHLSFASSHPGAQPYDQVRMEYGAQVLWPAHCVIGQPGAGFHPDLDVDRADLILRKGFRRAIDSYSAFRENDRRTQTGLAGYLRDRGVTRISLCGLALDFCVAWTAIDARDHGLEVRVLQDACRAIDLDGSLDAARRSMRDAGVTLA